MHGERRDGGEPLLIRRDGPDPVAEVTLDPANPGVPSVAGPFPEWPSLIYFPATGCDDFTVKWEGGGWEATIPFVAPSDIPGPPGVSTPAG